MQLDSYVHFDPFIIISKKHKKQKAESWYLFEKRLIKVVLLFTQIFKYLYRRHNWKLPQSMQSQANAAESVAPVYFLSLWEFMKEAHLLTYSPVPHCPFIFLPFHLVIRAHQGEETELKLN